VKLLTLVGDPRSRPASEPSGIWLAQDVFRLGRRLCWVMETSLLKTLAGKHRLTVTSMARKYKATPDHLPVSSRGQRRHSAPGFAGSLWVREKSVLVTKLPVPRRVS